jgi:hypothetical protein
MGHACVFTEFRIPNAKNQSTIAQCPRLAATL